MEYKTFDNKPSSVSITYFVVVVVVVVVVVLLLVENNLECKRKICVNNNERT